MTYYLFLLVLCAVAEVFYFRIADKFNIIDKPNERSSHSSITIRGGGVVFSVAGVAMAIYSAFFMPWFWLGFILISILSFVDDVKTLSSKVRLPLQIFAVMLLVFQGLHDGAPLWIWLVAVVLATGIINAYNFMDGINGITAGYSLVVLFSLLWINQSIAFADDAFIVTFIIADVVFGFFNFRKKAKCFAGDVGSVSIAFVIVFLLFELILKTQNFFYIMLLAVYGADSVLTIIYRLRKKENIFEAHRSHLYQWLVKPGPFSHLQMSGMYMILQVFVSVGVIFLINEGWVLQLSFSASVLIIFLLIYVNIKRVYKTRYGLV